MPDLLVYDAYLVSAGHTSEYLIAKQLENAASSIY